MHCYAAQGELADEYQVKAAYMYNFAKFVDWPATVLDNPLQPIVFCVLGRTSLSQALREALVGKFVERRPLEFRQLTDPTQASTCQILFIASTEKKQLRHTLEELKTLPVLTVGECEDFTSSGGIVRFLLDAGKVRLEFNMDAIENAQLRVSSKLLGLGRTVARPAK
jgi:hypothetical protein